MEKKNKLLAIAFALVAGLAACEKKYIEPEQPVKATTEETTSDNKAALPVIEARAWMTEGIWRITSYTGDFTLTGSGDFRNYEYKFLKTDVVVAKSNNRRVLGKWHKEGTSMLIMFDADMFTPLNNENWHFQWLSKNKFSLKGVSPWGHTSSEVVFERW